jgi:hypothetical protein
MPPCMSGASLAHLAEMRERGFTVIPGVVPADVVDAISENVMRAAERRSSNDARARGTLHLPSLLNYDQSLAPFLAQRAVLDVVEAHLGVGARMTFSTSQTNLPGCERGVWHADYPYNQSNMQRVVAPYPAGPDHSFGITTLWMMSEFKPGCGTLVVPFSHLQPVNPTIPGAVPACGESQLEPHPDEVSVAGAAGSVLMMDSRVWHAVPPWPAAEQYPDPVPRVSVAVRFSPWWMDVETLAPDGSERQRLLEATRRADADVSEGNFQAPVPFTIWESLPEDLKPLLWHRVAERPRF